MKIGMVNDNTNFETDLNYDEYGICEIQAHLFEYVANQGVDIEWFTKAYLCSDFCRRAMDTIYSRFQTADELEHLDFLLPEVGTLQEYEDNTMFDPDVAWWIGFTYRQLYIQTQISSKELYERISFETMCRYYPGLHTVDEEMATDIICENFGLQKVIRK